jgi:predicted PurR-regulated permease PerM
LAIAALIIAIITVVLCWIPFVGPVIALVALVLGIVAWMTSKSAGRPLGIAIAATIVSALALLAGIILTILLVWVFNQFGDDIRECNNANLTDQQKQTCLENRINDHFGIDQTP